MSPKHEEMMLSNHEPQQVLSPLDTLVWEFYTGHRNSVKQAQYETLLENVLDFNSWSSTLNPSLWSSIADSI